MKWWEKSEKSLTKLAQLIIRRTLDTLTRIRIAYLILFYVIPVAANSIAEEE